MSERKSNGFLNESRQLKRKKNPIEFLPADKIWTYIDFSVLDKLRPRNCFCFDLKNWQNNFRFTNCAKQVNYQRISYQIMIFRQYF